MAIGYLESDVLREAVIRRHWEELGVYPGFDAARVLGMMVEMGMSERLCAAVCGYRWWEFRNRLASGRLDPRGSILLWQMYNAHVEKQASEKISQR